MSDLIRTRHTVSGVIDPNTPRHIFEHPVFGRYLEEVDEDAKPFVAALHKPVDVDGNPVDSYGEVHEDEALIPLKAVTAPVVIPKTDKNEKN